MITKRLYYDNVYMQEFTATVDSCLVNGDVWKVILDATAFYPEGGGQPCDLGTLTALADCAEATPATEAARQSEEAMQAVETDVSVEETMHVIDTDVSIVETMRAIETDVSVEGTMRALATANEVTKSLQESEKAEQATVLARVLDVQEEDGRIVHTVDKPFKPGTQVRGKIDWDRRFNLMQQHSGEHIVSGMIHEKYGYDNVGFHMGEEFITIDLNGLLDEKQLEEIESKVNAYIWSNQKVAIFFPSREELDQLPYRSKKELTGEVRLVEFPGADLCACCGTHVAYTGEIGMVRLISVHKFRSGVRIEMLSGKKAFDYMKIHENANSKVAVALSVKPDQTPDAVARMSKELYDTKGALAAAKKEYYEFMAEGCKNLGNVFLCQPSMDTTEIRKCADRILQVCGGICVMISGDDERGYQYFIGEKDGNVRELVKEWNQRFEGRGGGKPAFAQGKVKGPYEDMKRYLEAKGFTCL